MDFWHRLQNAYANFAPHVGYCQGMNFVVGFILLVSSFAEEVEVFWFFVVLMSKYNLHGFFREGFPLLELYIHSNGTRFLPQPSAAVYCMHAGAQDRTQ